MAKRAKSRTGFKVPAQLDALPDPLDFRDRMFQASLVEVPIEIPLASYLEAEVPVLDRSGNRGRMHGFRACDRRELSAAAPQGHTRH